MASLYNKKNAWVVLILCVRIVYVSVITLTKILRKHELCFEKYINKRVSVETYAADKSKVTTIGTLINVHGDEFISLRLDNGTEKIIRSPSIFSIDISEKSV